MLLLARGLPLTPGWTIPVNMHETTRPPSCDAQMQAQDLWLKHPGWHSFFAQFSKIRSTSSTAIYG